MFNFKKKSVFEPSYVPFQGEDSGLPLIGSYDENLYKYGNRKKYFFVLGVSVQGFKSRENGLPENRNDLNDFEDKIINIVKKECDGFFACRVFWNKAMELLFYITDYQKIIEPLESLRKSKGIFPFAFKIEKDPGWKLFKHSIGK